MVGLGELGEAVILFSLQPHAIGQIVLAVLGVSSQDEDSLGKGSVFGLDVAEGSIILRQVVVIQLDLVLQLVAAVQLRLEIRDLKFAISLLLFVQSIQ